MTTKKVSFGMTPVARPAPVSPAADQWIEQRRVSEAAEQPEQPMKRLTIDIPEYLHRRIKATCAQRGVKMADEIRTMLEQHFVE